MQAVERETLILYHTELRGQWPEEAARALALRLPYAKRLAVGGGSARARASLAGIALALRALTRASGVRVAPRELLFRAGAKPALANGATGALTRCDFSISHSGELVGCAAVAHGRVGFDLESGAQPRLRSWVRREAALKAAGLGLAHHAEVQLRGAQARCAGQRWHARMLGCFSGACACVMTSFAVRDIEVRALSLPELFAP